MAWKQQLFPPGPNIRRASEARMKEMTLQADLERKNLKAQEKPWYEKYLIEPAIQIGTTALGGALGGALGEAMSPAASAATALATQKTSAMADTALKDRYAQYTQGWMRQNPGKTWSFATHGHLLDPDLKAWAAKREPTARR